MRRRAILCAYVRGSMAEFGDQQGITGSIEPDPPNTEWTVFEGVCIRGSPITSIPSSTLAECKFSCVAGARCRALTFKTSGTCELHSSFFFREHAVSGCSSLVPEFFTHEDAQRMRTISKGLNRAELLLSENCTCPTGGENGEKDLSGVGAWQQPKSRCGDWCAVPYVFHGTWKAVMAHKSGRYVLKFANPPLRRQAAAREQLNSEEVEEEMRSRGVKLMQDFNSAEYLHEAGMQHDALAHSPLIQLRVHAEWGPRTAGVAFLQEKAVGQTFNLDYSTDLYGGQIGGGITPQIDCQIGRHGGSYGGGTGCQDDGDELSRADGFIDSLLFLEVLVKQRGICIDDLQFIVSPRGAKVFDMRRVEAAPQAVVNSTCPAGFGTESVLCLRSNELRLRLLSLALSIRLKQLGALSTDVLEADALQCSANAECKFGCLLTRALPIKPRRRTAVEQDMCGSYLLSRLQEVQGTHQGGAVEGVLSCTTLTQHMILRGTA